MLIDKEYPATHSMSTSWYIVDEEGNVGIMDFNANGPVPWGTEDISIDYLVWNDYDEVYDVDLKEEQLLYMLGDPEEPKGCLYYRDYIIQIDSSQKVEFVSLCAKNKLKIKTCLSESLGLYQMSCDINLEDDDEALRALSKIIKKVYRKNDFDIDEDYEDGKWTPYLNFEKIPYYLYWQPYSSTQLSELVHKPDCPVKISQMSERMQKKAFHLPIKFKDSPKLQIAEFIPCGVLGLDASKVEYINGCEYGLLPLSNGQMAYCLLSIEGHDLDTLPPLPYQSTEYPLVISVEEMKRLKGL